MKLALIVKPREHNRWRSSLTWKLWKEIRKTETAVLLRGHSPTRQGRPHSIKTWYVAFFRLPILPERMLTANGGAIVRRMFGDVALPPDVLAVYTGQITEPGAARAMLNWWPYG